jgi:uncharacterized protein involved in outer membrane biogenesis
MIYSNGVSQEARDMGKAGKVILGLVIVFVVVCGFIVTLVLQNLDAIIKQVIEDVGSEVVGTPVTVSEVKFMLQEGRGEIYGLRIGNPPGFSSRHAFEMEEIAVQIEPKSLTGPVIVINEVLVDGARLVAEQKGTSTNLKQLMDGMKSTSSEPAPPPSGEPTDVRLMLEKFAFVNSKADLQTEQFGDKTLDIPAIRMANIGDRETGLTPEQLTGKMMKKVVRQAEKAVTNYLENLVKGAAKEEIDRRIDEKLGAEDREKLEGLKGMLKEK